MEYTYNKFDNQDDFIIAGPIISLAPSLSFVLAWQL